MSTPDELEDRIHRIEAALAERKSIPSDDAIAERVLERLSAMAGRAPEADRVLVLAPHADAPPPPPHGAVLHPPAATGGVKEHQWFISQIAAELRLVATMYFDPRYRISRTTQFALPGIALILIFNYFFFGVWVSITFVSPVVERLLAVVLAIVGYRLLTHELIRYREVLAYLARYGR